MAVTLINSISSIPGSPTAGDIIRFSVVITSGIPSTVKKANGTTRETTIAVGSEYRYIGTNWLKIGGDEIVTTPLKDATVLASSEFGNMIMAAVHNSQNAGRLRQFGASLLHQALQEANPLEGSTERIILFNESTNAGNNNLGIRTGVIRHSFNDDYFAIAFIGTQSNFPNDSFPLLYIPIEIWDDTNSGQRLQYFTRGTSVGTAYIYKVSNTSFNINAPVPADLKIYGYKLSFALETPA